MPLPQFNSESFKKNRIKYILAGLVLLLLLIGVGVGMYLTSRSQEVRQQASVAYTCAGGLNGGDHTCIGFRDVGVCTATGIVHEKDCSSTESCQGGVCKTLAAQACADGTASGSYSCDTLHSKVLCTNGSFGSSISCGTQTCSAGVCGGSSGTQCPT